MHHGRAGPASCRQGSQAQVTWQGPETREHWQLGCSLYTAFVFSDWLRVLLQLPRDERPDTMVIADDNLVEPLRGVLGDAGDLRIVAHCSYPELPLSAVPVHDVGFDLHTLMDECLRCLRRRGRRQAG